MVPHDITHPWFFGGSGGLWLKQHSHFPLVWIHSSGRFHSLWFTEPPAGAELSGSSVLSWTRTATSSFEICSPCHRHTDALLLAFSFPTPKSYATSCQITITTSWNRGVRRSTRPWTRRGSERQHSNTPPLHRSGGIFQLERVVMEWRDWKQQRADLQPAATLETVRTFSANNGGTQVLRQAILGTPASSHGAGPALTFRSSPPPPVGDPMMDSK